MYKSKIILIISKLDANALKRLEQFIQSDYYNIKTEVRAIIAMCIKAAPEFMNYRLERKSLYSIIHPNQEFDENKWNKYSIQCMEVLEQFIIAERLQQERVLKNTLLVKEYKRLNITNLSSKAYSKLHKTIEETKLYEPDYFYHISQMYHCKISDSDLLTINDFDINLEFASVNLELFYIENKLRYCCELLTRNTWLKTAYQDNFLMDFIAIIAKNNYLQHQSIKNYYTIAMTLIEPENEVHFFNLKKIIINEIDDYPQPELNDIWTYAANYCATKINSGYENFNNELFLLYKKALVLNIFTYEQKIKSSVFSNIVNIAIILKEFQWIEKFIEKFKDMIEPDSRMTVYSFSIAQLEFEKGNYSKAQEYLLKVEDFDLSHYLKSKILLLKIFYHKKEYQPLMNLCNTLLKYIQRNTTLHLERKLYHTSFIKQLMKLVITPKGDLIKLDILLNEVKNETSIVNRPWLLEQVLLKKTR